MSHKLASWKASWHGRVGPKIIFCAGSIYLRFQHFPYYWCWANRWVIHSVHFLSEILESHLQSLTWQVPFWKMITRAPSEFHSLGCFAFVLSLCSNIAVYNAIPDELLQLSSQNQKVMGSKPLQRPEHKMQVLFILAEWMEFILDRMAMFNLFRVYILIECTSSN